MGSTPPIRLEGGPQTVNRGIHLMARLRLTCDLQAQVADKVYAPLAAFGVTMAEVSPNDVDEEVADGELELQVGRLMEKLKDLRYFVERGRMLGQNLMQQLANLYKDDRVRGQNTSFAGVVRNFD